jgi:hypothetical protein
VEHEPDVASGLDPSPARVKRCFNCKAMLNASEFHRDRAKRDGLTSDCKSCRNHKRKEERSGSPDRSNRHSLLSKDPSTMTGVCQICGPTRIVLKNSGYGKKGLRCRTPIRKHKNKTNSRLKKKYGMTLKERQAFREGKACAICGERTPRKLTIDHCHATGKVRGVLCFHCNFGIGIFREDTNVMKNAILYLQEA